MTEMIILVLVFTFILCTSNVMCFYIGAKTGQKVVNKEKLKLKLTPPSEKIREHKAKKEEREKLDVYSALIENVEKYDGTSYGQKDIPKVRD